MCPKCGSEIKYLSKDLRPVFPEERLLLEILLAKPFDFANNSVWANGSRYYIDGKAKNLPSKIYTIEDVSSIVSTLEELSELNNKNYYPVFNKFISNFIEINKNRFEFIEDEAIFFYKRIS